MKHKMTLLALCGLLAASTAASAADGMALYTSKGCTACHGAGGATPIMPIYPKLAGQNEQYLLTQMKDIKSGARANGMSAAMKPIIANVSDDEMAAIATYLANAK